MREWWSPSEIAEAGLPDLPGTKRGVTAIVHREGWQSDLDRAKKRHGKGGGWIYHFSLFPARAQAAVVKANAAAEAAVQAAERSRDLVWAEFDKLTKAAKAKAAKRLAVLEDVDLLTQGAIQVNQAVTIAARNAGVSARSVFGWLNLVKGVAVADRLAYLAPRHQTAKRKVDSAVISPEAWEWFKTAYLRQGEIVFAECYRKLTKLAEAHGWKIPSEQSLRRKIKREIPADVLVLQRKGPRALEALYPAQVRDKKSLQAMEVVNADFHRWDVFVLWDGKIVRPQICVFQDIYSGKILSWRFSLTPNTLTVQLAFGDMVERYGVPQHCVLDNGREFASKWFTGGVPQRFRGVVKEDDVWGTLPAMGIKVHWAQPYHGQAKPVERAFRDFANNIAKDIRFDGAWTGNSPGAKPENYGNAAVEFELFEAVVNAGIAEHNARIGRDSEICAGRSFDKAFNDSYAKVTITKVTDEQRRFWLLGTERLRANSQNGEISFLGNKYWSPWMVGIAGEHVFVRFDPDNLHDGVHIYDADNAYLAHAECHSPEGFLDVAAARAHAKAKRAFKRSARDMAEAEITMSKAEAGALLTALHTPEDETPEARIIRPAFPARQVAPPRPEPRALTDAEEAQRESIVAAFVRPEKPETTEDEGLARYREAVALEARIAAGEDVDPASRDHLRIYQAEPEYQAFAKMRERFGDSAIM